jgi:hypothetical protein
MWLIKGRVDAVANPQTIVGTMRLSTLLPALGLVTKILSTSLSCEKDVDAMGLVESDAAVAEYFAKLEPATKRALLHEITGPEAGADVR